jgi:CoA-substrate-specific enzyme activase, putative
MKSCYLGIDIGSISTKAALIDDNYNVLSSCYIETKGNPINAVKEALRLINIPYEYQLKGIGTTGSARKLIGIMLNANIVKNEITAHAIGTMTYHPEVKTILEIGGQDSKVILIRNGMIKDYAMNTLCAAGTGAFLSSQAKRLGIDVEEFGAIALTSKNPTKIAARCTVFAESDLVHKSQIGYKKEDIVAGLCKSVALNYLNNVCKGKKIDGPVIFQGGVSKNVGVLKFFEEVLDKKIITDPNGHLMGALGVAILASKKEDNNGYSTDIEDMEFNTVGVECSGCTNSCELLKIYKDNILIDTWGSKCGKY